MVRPTGARQNFAIGDLSGGGTYEIPGANNHVEKRKQRNKALTVVFDPQAHKEFVTGFRKRKMQRRKVALKDQDEKARKIRIEERKKHREDRKKALNNRMVGGSEEPEGGAGREGDEEGEGEEEAADLQKYESGGQTTYVQVEAIKTGSDFEESGGEEGEEEGGEGASEAAKAKAALAGKPKVRDLKGKKLTEALKGTIKQKKGFKKPKKKTKVAKRKGHK